MFEITEQERAHVLETFFPNGLENGMTQLPRKEKRKYIILQLIHEALETDRTFSEKELNEELKKYTSDYATVRRYLVDYGFISRDPAGQVYQKVG